MTHQPIPEEKDSIADMLPAVFIALMIFVGIHILNQMMRHELFLLKDQAWKLTTIEIQAPYRYDVRKLKNVYSFYLYKDNTEIFSQDCKYPLLSLCKSEHPIPSNTIKYATFYESYDPKLKQTSFGDLRLKSLILKDSDHLEQQINILKNSPNTARAIRSQKSALLFNLFLSSLGLLLVCYLISLLSAFPQWMRKTLYLLLGLDGFVLVIYSLWVILR